MKGKFTAGCFPVSGFAFLLMVCILWPMTVLSQDKRNGIGTSAMTHSVDSRSIAPDAYEPDNTWQTSKVIMLNDQKPYTDFTFLYPIQDHNFHVAGDVDWVKFFILKDEIYKITVDSPGENCDVVITIYDTDGQTVIKEVDDTFAGEKEYAEWECEADGLYFASIRQYDPKLYGSGTNYRLSLTQPYMAFSGRIWGYVTPPMEANLSTGYSSGCSNAEGKYLIPHLAGNFTITAVAEGCSRCMTPVSVPEKDYVRADIDLSLSCEKQTGTVQGFLTPEDAVSAGAKWRVGWGDWQNSGAFVTDVTVGSHTVEFKELTGWTTPPNVPVNVVESQTISISGDYKEEDFCLEVDGARDISVSCVKYKGAKFAFTLNYYTKVEDPSEMYWKMNMPTLGSTGSNACVSIGDDLGMSIPCAEYNGTQYEFDLDYYNDPDDASGYRWKIDRSSLQVKQP
jgi:hypothetical protein